MIPADYLDGIDTASPEYPDDMWKVKDITKTNFTMDCTAPDTDEKIRIIVEPMGAQSNIQVFKKVPVEEIIERGYDCGDTDRDTIVLRALRNPRHNEWPVDVEKNGLSIESEIVLSDIARIQGNIEITHDFEGFRREHDDNNFQEEVEMPDATEKKESNRSTKASEVKAEKTTENKYDKLLLDGMRMVSFEEGTSILTNEDLTKAVTMNENLKSLGYTLKPTDIVRIATSPSVDSFYDKVKAQMSSVNAKPLYPDFPKQVMEMDEAQFRLHQAIHYFSTYGIEFLTGEPVSEGWLPAKAGLVSDTEKTEQDTRLLKAKPIELIEEKNKYQVPFERILSKRERMTHMEEEIVKTCVESGKIPFDRKYDIPFKENLEPVFKYIAEAGANGTMDRKEAAEALHNICQHPGDVTKSVHKYLTGHNYRLRTTEKKMFVDTYEKFDARSFAENTHVSNKRAQFTREIFNRIDFTKYAHDQEMIEAVKQIGKTHTWEAEARKKIENQELDAIKFASQRPGMLIRMTSMALRNGYSEEEIADALKEKSGDISVQTTVSMINRSREDYKKPKGLSMKTRAINGELQKARSALTVMGPDTETKTGVVIKSHIENLEKKVQNLTDKEGTRAFKKEQTKSAEERIFTGALEARLEQIHTGFRGKKLYLDEEIYDFSEIKADPSEKNMNQAYLPSATVAKIPDNVDRVRCFVYWNDKKRVDLDLHTTATTKDGGYIHVGWDGDYNNSGIVTSGDITHSDAAEYIDIDLKKTSVKYVKMSIDSFTEQNFSDIKTCFVGMMAVDKLGESVSLYDPANCFFSNDIKNESTSINYGMVDVENRKMIYLGVDQDREAVYEPPKAYNNTYSLKEYITTLAKAQDAVIVDNKEDADVVLTLCKPASDKEISLIDNNYFYDAKIETEEQKKEYALEQAAKEVREAAHNSNDLMQEIQDGTILTKQEAMDPGFSLSKENEGAGGRITEIESRDKGAFIRQSRSAKSLDDILEMTQSSGNAGKEKKSERKSRPEGPDSFGPGG